MRDKFMFLDEDVLSPELLTGAQRDRDPVDALGIDGAHLRESQNISLN
jgi:hypothetical protein